MKTFKILQAIAVVAYSVIILKGQILGAPFLPWLMVTVFDFGNIDQLFAISAVFGLVIIFKNRNKTRTLKILLVDFLCFFLLASPVIGRLSAVPLYMFNYGAFTIPTAIFVLFYLVSLVFSCKEYLVYKKILV